MKIREIIEWLDENELEYRFEGSMEEEICGFSSLSNYKERHLTWIKECNGHSIQGKSENIFCAVIQTGANIEVKNAIYVENAKEVFFDILHHFWGKEYKRGSVGEGTVICGEVHIDPTATVGCNCTITGHVDIGADTVIGHNVVIEGKVSIGRNCHIQSLAVIGIDGYGYSQEKETKRKTMVEHFGGVVIGDDVFVGSHANIARGTIDDTEIGNGTKIAPSTHIGHNNIVGEDVAIICSTLYGSVKTGDRSYITDSTIQNQMTVGHDTVIGMGSVVVKPVGDNVIAYGIPAEEKKENDSEL